MNEMLKLAYETGALKALQDMGFTKEAIIPIGGGALIGAAGAESGERGVGALRGAGAGLGVQMGASAGGLGGLALGRGLGGTGSKTQVIMALLGLLGGGAAGGYGGYRGMKALTGD